MVIVLYMSRCLGLTFYSSGWLIRSPTSLAAAVPSQGWQTPNVFLCFPLPLRQDFKSARPLSTPSDVSTYVNIYIELYIYIYMCMCVFMCCHIHYPSNLIVPLKICLISAILVPGSQGLDSHSCSFHLEHWHASVQDALWGQLMYQLFTSYLASNFLQVTS